MLGGGRPSGGGGARVGAERGKRRESEGVKMRGGERKERGEGYLYPGSFRVYFSNVVAFNSSFVRVRND